MHEALCFAGETAVENAPKNFPRYAALDLGTNSCRLLIVQTYAAKNRPSFFYKRIYAFSRMIHLGEDLHKMGALSDQAIDRAIGALRVCANHLRRYQVEHVRCVATAACRTAKNTPFFLQRIKAETGLNLEVISPLEEGRLAVMGCIELMPSDIPYGLVFDIGGGSTEIVFVHLRKKKKFEILDSISLPYGVLSLHNMAGNIEEDITNHVTAFAERNNLFSIIANKMVQMVGVSGTITTLAAMRMNLPKYDRVAVHKTRLSKGDIAGLLQTIDGYSKDDLLAHPCVGEARISLVSNGLRIFRTLYGVLSAEHVVVADRGVREGVILDLTRSQPPSQFR